VRETGTVSWFNNSKGYGFIKRDNQPDVFVHFTGIEGTGYRSLNEGDQVEFDLVNGAKGMQAEGVRIIREAKPGGKER
jgi:cold shock protein